MLFLASCKEISDMKMLAFRPLLFLTIAMLFLRVNCQGIDIDIARHPHGWAAWSSWTRERECLSGTCVGNDTESAETVPETSCSPTDIDRKNIPSWN